MRRTQRALARRPHAIAAAATRIGAPAATGDPTAGFSISLPRPAEWSEKAWEYLTRVGELSYYVNWRSNAVGRAQLVAAARDPLTGMPTSIPEDDRAGQLVANIVRDIGGNAQATILKRLAVFLSVPGDGYAAMLVRDGVEKWYALSREEIGTSGGQKVLITLPDKTKHEFNRDADLLFRVWDPDHRRSWEPTSPVRANLDVLQEIVRATQTIDNANSSRLIGKGILFVPDEMNLPSTTAPRAERAGDQPPNPAPVTQWEQASSQDLQDLLFEVGTTAYKDQTSMAAMFPIVATVPGEYADKVKHLTFGTDIPETALKTREAAIRRLALGLDVSPERLLGLSTGNHWSAWAIGEDDVRLHIVPVLEMIADAFTEFVLRPALSVIGIDPDAYVVHFDVSGLTQDPDRSAEVLQLLAVGAISHAAGRRYLGFNDEDGYDLETIDGWRELARDKAAQDITLLAQIGPLAAPPGVVLDVAPAPAALPAAEQSTAPDPVPNQSEPATEAQAGIVVDMCVRRALELAGKRMLTRNNRYAVPQQCPAYEVHRHLVPPAPSDVARLTDGWADTLSPDMLAHAGIRPDALHRVVTARVMSELLGRR